MCVHKCVFLFRPYCACVCVFCVGCSQWTTGMLRWRRPLLGHSASLLNHTSFPAPLMMLVEQLRVTLLQKSTRSPVYYYFFMLMLHVPSQIIKSQIDLFRTLLFKPAAAPSQ